MSNCEVFHISKLRSPYDWNYLVNSVVWNYAWRPCEYFAFLTKYDINIMNRLNETLEGHWVHYDASTALFISSQLGISCDHMILFEKEVDASNILLIT